MMDPNNAAKEPLLRLTLSSQIYEILKQDIIFHRICPGEKLINRELQERFGVSSTPVRDAINHLYLDGLVEEITNVGAKVIALDANLRKDIVDVTKVLTQAALIRTAAAQNTQKMCARLDDILARANNIDNIAAFIQIDQQFHQALFDFCGNTELKKLYSHYGTLIEMMTSSSHAAGAKSLDWLGAHRPIVEACRANDIDEALARVDNHYAEKLIENLAGIQEN